MSTIFRKALHFGIGAAAMAKKRADKMTNRMLEKGRTSEQKGEELLQAYEDTRKDKQKKLEEEIKAGGETILHKMNIPTRSEMMLLEKRIEVLEKALADKKSTNE